MDIWREMREAEALARRPAAPQGPPLRLPGLEELATGLIWTSPRAFLTRALRGLDAIQRRRALEFLAAQCRAYVAEEATSAPDAQRLARRSAFCRELLLCASWEARGGLGPLGPVLDEVAGSSRRRALRYLERLGAPVGELLQALGAQEAQGALWEDAEGALWDDAEERQGEVVDPRRNYARRATGVRRAPRWARDGA